MQKKMWRYYFRFRGAPVVGIILADSEQEAKVIFKTHYPEEEKYEVEEVDFKKGICELHYGH